MSQHYFLVDAFARQPFSGNQAAVMLLEKPLDETTMQAIAAELNIAETAFVSEVDKATGQYAIRWFAPNREVELCGHATLASAHVLFEHMGSPQQTLVFDSVSGPLSTSRNSTGQIELDFPANRLAPVTATAQLEDALAAKPQQVFASDTRMLAVFACASEVAALDPDMNKLLQIPQYGICCAAVGDGEYTAYDYICRFFAPAAGIPEDPVTGSAQTTLAPYFADVLGKTVFSARQISKRGGNLHVTLKQNRVAIAGNAVTVAEGDFYI